jgi:predicted MFS family arabinose efflux permease
MLRLVPLLIGVAFLDELASGIPFVGAPEIKSEFGLSYAAAAGYSFAAMTVLAILLEPPLFLLADRLPRRWFVCGGLAALGAVCIAAGLAPGYGFLIAALLLYGPLSGCGVALAQATLADARHDDLERVLVRWTFAGALGDLATPALVALAAVFTIGWRGAFVASGVILVLYAGLLWTRPFPLRAPTGDAEPEGPGLVRSLGLALRDRRLAVWAFAVTLCALMDEILVAFTSLYLRDVLGMDLASRSAALSLLLVGALAGLAAGDTLLRHFEARRILLSSALLCAGAWLGFLNSGSALAASASLFATGLTAAIQYPIAKAQAYRAFPGRSGAVNAVLTLFGVLELPLPILLGWLGDRFGLEIALGALIVQPLGLAWLAFASRGDDKLVDPGGYTT